MAFGEHWEWRGFGQLSAGLRQRIEALPLLFPTAQDVTDTYLWSSTGTLNVKLRGGDLKLKRLLETRDSLEHWLEDPKENFPFPLSDAARDELTRCLGVQLKSAPPETVTRESLLDWLASAAADVQTIDVVKTRRQYTLVVPVGSTEHKVTVELAEISAPEVITSVGLECAERQAVAAAMTELSVGELPQLNYLQALAIWATGRTLS